MSPLPSPKSVNRRLKYFLCPQMPPKINGWFSYLCAASVLARSERPTFSPFRCASSATLECGQPSGYIFTAMAPLPRPWNAFLATLSITFFLLGPWVVLILVKSFCGGVGLFVVWWSADRKTYLHWIGLLKSWMFIGAFNNEESDYQLWVA